jgi:hypothetical protein
MWHQVMWPIAETLIKRDGSTTPTAVHGFLRIVCHQNEKANATADCLENQFTSHDLYDENYERRVTTRVLALLTTSPWKY